MTSEEPEQESISLNGSNDHQDESSEHATSLVGEERKQVSPSVKERAPTQKANRIFDVAIIGAGYGGLSAALMLGRYQIPTVIFDSGRPRNWETRRVHGYLGMNDVSPKVLLQKSWRNVRQYRCVRRIGKKVREVSLMRNTAESTDVQSQSVAPFVLKAEDGSTFNSKYLVLATGVEDIKPDGVKNFSRYDGEGAWHCPHCDGLETKGRKLALLCNGIDSGVKYAEEFLGWTRDIMLFIQPARGGAAEGEASKEAEERASKLGIRIVANDPVVEIIGGKRPRAVRCRSGARHRAEVIFYNLGLLIHNEIAAMVGCQLDQGFVKTTGRMQQTTVPRVYVAGDLDTDRHYVALATASGALAAISIYEEILKGSIRDAIKERIGS